MGQAIVDLPDPLSAAPVSSANTDDLLAQLAGEEIERLLAEADEAPAESKATLPAVEPSAAQARKGPAPSRVSTLVEAPVRVDRAVLDSEADTAADADLDALFSGLESNPSHPDKAAPAAPPAVATAVGDSAPSAANALAEEMAEDAATDAAGRSALGADAGVASDVSQSSSKADVSGKEYSIPLYLRVLNWISAPLESYPDDVRDLVGKIAILTTVNAAAVLAYVILFRRH